MRRVFSVSGTLGEAYLTVLKLYNLSMCNDINICYYTVQNSSHHRIREIYSLIPNTSVMFVNGLDKKHTRINPNFTEDDGDKLEAEPFPQFEFIYNPHLEECTENGLNFVCVSPSSGKDSKCRLIPEKHLINIYRYNKTLYVGDDIEFDTKYCDINMIGSTSLMNTLSVIAQCKEFHGYQGLCCFFALSQKIPVYIYCQDDKEIEELQGRVHVEWWKYIREIIKI